MDTTTGNTSSIINSLYLSLSTDSFSQTGELFCLFCNTNVSYWPDADVTVQQVTKNHPWSPLSTEDHDLGNVSFTAPLACRWLFSRSHELTFAIFCDVKPLLLDMDSVVHVVAPRAVASFFGKPDSPCLVLICVQA